MYRHRSGSSLTHAALAIVLIVVLALLVGGVAGCAKSDDTTPAKPDGSEATTGPEPGTGESETPEPEPESTVKAYFMTGEKLTPVAGTAVGKGVAAAAMELLLAGPKGAGLTSSIPAGTTLRGVNIVGKVATVDLSTEFTTGGGTLSMTSRVAQVVYTLTQFPTVDSVKFEVEGQTLDVLGGEGIMLEGAQTRTMWEEFAPAVLVESPTWNAEVPGSSALRVTGSANVFEGVFQLEIADATGKVVRTQRVQASAGTGTRGTFDASISLDGVKSGSAKLIASYLSAKDGSRVVVAEVPLTVK